MTPSRQDPSPERWAQIRDLFDEVVDLDPAERRAVLERRCAGDPELRSEVETLVSAAAEPTGALDLDAGQLVPTSWARGSGSASEGEGRAATPGFGGIEETRQEGRRLGSYRLLEELGRGGMGVVYLAERADGHYAQRVAIKLLRFAADEDGLARFSRERQILARLQHPHIARLLDGGVTPDNAPYLVMELVDGEPLDEFCERRGLDLDARLELFDQVCEAVAYAHRHLVIHRDLKPSNILICGDAGVKLLDFGIAKILKSDDEDQLTADLGQLMTPRYASPEQLQGGEVTAVSDVYQLGTTLYELVTGSGPFEAEGVAAHIHAVCFGTPKSPSRAVLEDTTRDAESRRTLARQIQGDLDAILFKALRREPELRYSSVEALRQDLDHYRRGFPITARPDSFGYRMRKFVGRHWVATAVSGVLLLGLIAGLVGSTLGLVRAQRAERQAMDARVQAENLVTFLLDDLHQSLSSVGRTDLLRRSAELTRDYFEDLPAELRGEARDRVARSHLQVGELLIKQGDFDAALVSLERARVASAPPQAGQETPGPGESVLIHGDAYYWVGRAHRLRGEQAEAEKAVRRAAEIFRDQSRTDSISEQRARRSRKGLASCHIELGVLMEEKGDPAEAFAEYRDAEAIHRALLAAEPENDGLRSDLVLNLYRLAWLHHLEGHDEQALEHFDELIPLLEGVVSRSPDDVTYRGSLALMYRKLAGLQDRAGRLSQAIASVRRAQEMNAVLVARDPGNAERSGSLASDHMDLSLLLWKRGRTEEALTEIDKSLALGESILWQQLPLNSKHHGSRAWKHLLKAWMLQDVGREGESYVWAEKAYDWSRNSEVPESSTSLGAWAAAAVTLGRRDEALEALRRAEELGWADPREETFIQAAMARGVLRWPAAGPGR